MSRGIACLMGPILISGVCSLNARADENRRDADSAQNEFVGSSPCDSAIRALLRIPAEVDAELMEWKLSLHQDSKTESPAKFTLRCDYGPTIAGKPGLGKRTGTVERQGRWSIRKGTNENPDAVVYELAGAVALVQIDKDVLHVLNRDRSLMVGNGGWSYTLSRASTAEKPGDASRAADLSYPIAAVSAGRGVSGVFEGRTPCHGIARALKQPEHPGCIKAKWRVTLYQDPKSGAPTTYKVEGTLYRKAAREGKWSIERGASGDTPPVVYRLAPTETDGALYLIRGDGNVLFFLDQNRRPLVGHAEFSYTLNRREAVELSSETR
jgi:hypothetical protein